MATETNASGDACVVIIEFAGALAIECAESIIYGAIPYATISICPSVLYYDFGMPLVANALQGIRKNVWPRMYSPGGHGGFSTLLIVVTGVKPRYHSTGTIELPLPNVAPFIAVPGCNSWTTNAAVEAAVRRVTPKTPKSARVSNTTKRKSKAAAAAAASASSTTSSPTTNPCTPAKHLLEDETGTKAESEQCGPATCVSNRISSGACIGQKRQRVASARLAEAVADAAEFASGSTVASKRLRGKTSTSQERDPPGAKRARAAASVAAYVQREYAKLGKPWPIERPTRVESDKASVDRLQMDCEAVKERCAEAAVRQDAVAPAAWGLPEVELSDGDSIASCIQGGAGEDDASSLVTACGPSVVEILGGVRVEENLTSSGVQQCWREGSDLDGSNKEVSGGCGSRGAGLHAASSFAMMFQAPHRQHHEDNYPGTEQHRCDRRPRENELCIAPCESWLPSSHGHPSTQCSSHGCHPPGSTIVADGASNTSSFQLPVPDTPGQRQFLYDRRGAAAFQVAQADEKQASFHTPAMAVARSSIEKISVEAVAVTPDVNGVCTTSSERGTPSAGRFNSLHSSEVVAAAVSTQGNVSTAGVNGLWNRHACSTP